MPIPLNIDTPSGVEFTVNKTVKVCSSGRIISEICCDNPKIKMRDNEVIIHLLNAKNETTITANVKEARLMAYEILKLTDPTV